MNLPLIIRAEEHSEKIAITTTDRSFTYRDLLHTSSQIATHILQNAEDLQEERVAFLIPPGFEYVATQWGIWRAGGIAVPLCVFPSASRIGVCNYQFWSIDYCCSS
ncbi:AMP-binding protein [Nostoc sp.]|uniref:AMP-binding protein n=1 Tax=Nostoc sp. TaxID=1180 RepID=UPI002FFCE327